MIKAELLFEPLLLRVMCLVNPLSKASAYFSLGVLFIYYYFVAILLKEEKQNYSPSENTHLLTYNDYVVSTMPGCLNRD